MLQSQAVGKDGATCIPAPHLFTCEQRVQILYEQLEKGTAIFGTCCLPINICITCIEVKGL